MKKYIITSTAFLIVFLIISGCSITKKEVDDEQRTVKKIEQTRGEMNFFDFDEERFIEGSLDDLKIGETILVTGNINSDGSVVAERIIIGDAGENFQDMFAGMRPKLKEGEETVNTEDRLPSEFKGQQFNFEQFQNLSEEEREKIREEMMVNGRGGRIGVAQRDFGQATMRGAGQGVANLTGEVISKDDSSITIKLGVGGSKIVFFSESTVVMIIATKEDEQVVEN